jgi:hypothetical protein
MPALFSPGRIVATAGAMLSLPPDSITAAVRRHLTGDWGECDEEDKRANDQSVKDGERIISVYTISGQKTFIITEADRSVTTVLLAEEC